MYWGKRKLEPHLDCSAYKSHGRCWWVGEDLAIPAKLDFGLGNSSAVHDPLLVRLYVRSHALSSFSIGVYHGLLAATHPDRVILVADYDRSDHSDAFAVFSHSVRIFPASRGDRQSLLGTYVPMLC